MYRLVAGVVATWACYMVLLAVEARVSISNLPVAMVVSLAALVVACRILLAFTDWVSAGAEDGWTETNRQG